jgi:ribosomal protein S18 acetylase RimI-like enzyme
MFHCKITGMDIESSNINIWEKKVKLSSMTIPPSFYKKYGLNNLTEYIKIIKDNINNQERLDELNYIFESNRKRIEEQNNRDEKERIKKLLLESSKRYSSNIKIRMLRESDEKRAKELYKQFKIELGDDASEIDMYTRDFILKNIMYGIFISSESSSKNILAGFIIIDYKRKFKIDNSPTVDTFYIQEIIIDKDYRRKGYAELLFHYIIIRCPSDMLYISFMTMPSNKGMIQIAKKHDFKLQDTPSGDSKHSLLFIKNNDKLDINYNKAFYTGSVSSSSK